MTSRKKASFDLFKLLWPYLFMLCGSVFVRVPTNVKLRAERDLSNPILTLISILTAITITSFTLFLSENNRTFKKYPGELKDLISEHVQSIYSGVLTCLLCFVVILFMPNPSTPAEYKNVRYGLIDNIILCSWVMSFCLSVSLFLRVVTSFHMLTNKVLHDSRMSMRLRKTPNQSESEAETPNTPPQASVSSDSDPIP
jgi:hypothetical protein